MKRLLVGYNYRQGSRENAPYFMLIFGRDIFHGPQSWKFGFEFSHDPNAPAMCTGADMYSACGGGSMLN